VDLVWRGAILRCFSAIGALAFSCWAFLAAAPVSSSDPRIALVAASDTANDMKTLCAAENAARSLLREDPLNELALVRYAGALQNLNERGKRAENDGEKTQEKTQEKTELKTPGCSHSEPAGEIAAPDIDSVIALALQRNPHSRPVLLVASMLAQRQDLLIANDLSDASVKRKRLFELRAERLNAVLQTTGVFSASQRQVLNSQLDSPEIIKAAVAHDMRTVILVSALKAVPESYSLTTDLVTSFGNEPLRRAIEELQIAALTELSSGLPVSVPPTVQESELRALASVAASAQVISLTDAKRFELAKLRGQDDQARLFKTRAGMRSQPIIRAVLANDTTPETGALVRFRRSEFFILDTRDMSVGAALKQNPERTTNEQVKQISAVQLLSGDPSARLLPGEVSIWTSADNLTWTRAGIKNTISARIDADSVLFLELDTAQKTGVKDLSPQLFIKVRFNLSLTRGKFRDASFRLLQVFKDA